jgi:hypothetical protein
MQWSPDGARHDDVVHSLPQAHSDWDIVHARTRGCRRSFSSNVVHGDAAACLSAISASRESGPQQPIAPSCAPRLVVPARCRGIEGVRGVARHARQEQERQQRQHGAHDEEAVLVAVVVDSTPRHHATTTASPPATPRHTHQHDGGERGLRLSVHGAS